MDKNIMQKDLPFISVLMSVYNSEKYLTEAIESVLSQTYSNFEFIIIDDGSTDNSTKILASFNDERIKIFTNESNLGLIASLNLGLSYAGGEYIARMDSDDICYPQRLKKQLDFLVNNPSIGLCGSWISIINEKRVIKFPVTHKEIKIALLKDNPIAHPSVMLRNSIIKKMELQYDSRYKGAEDYELWSRLIFYTKFAILPQPLVYYRRHTGQVTQSNNEIVNESTQTIKLRLLQQFKILSTIQEKKIHLSLFDQNFANLHGTPCLKEADHWLYKLYISNKKLKVFDENLFCLLWQKKIFITTIKDYDLKVWNILSNSFCFKYAKVSGTKKIEILAKCLLKPQLTSKKSNLPDG